jgi:hypothetical protein
VSRLRSLLKSAAVGVAALAVSLVLAPPAFGQYMGSNSHGDFGVNSGSQAGPGFYFAIPFAQWNADHIKDADGNTVLGSSFEGFDVRAVFPTVIVVTSKKLLGANYGFMVASLVNARYLWESGGKSSFQGSTFVVGLTIARPKVN